MIAKNVTKYFCESVHKSIDLTLSRIIKVVMSVFFSFLFFMFCWPWIQGPLKRSSSHLRRHWGLGDTDWGAEHRHWTWLSDAALVATHNWCLVVSHHKATIVAIFHVFVVSYTTVRIFARYTAILSPGLEERGELDALVLATLLHLLLNSLDSIVVHEFSLFLSVDELRVWVVERATSLVIEGLSG